MARRLTSKTRIDHGVVLCVQFRTLKNYKDGAFLGPRIGDKLIFSLLIFRQVPFTLPGVYISTCPPLMKKRKLHAQVGYLKIALNDLCCAAACILLWAMTSTQTTSSTLRQCCSCGARCQPLGRPPMSPLLCLSDPFSPGKPFCSSASPHLSQGFS